MIPTSKPVNDGNTRRRAVTISLGWPLLALSTGHRQIAVHDNISIPNASSQVEPTGYCFAQPLVARQVFPCAVVMAVQTLVVDLHMYWAQDRPSETE